jgi:hypothetical protein
MISAEVLHLTALITKNDHHPLLGVIAQILEGHVKKSLRPHDSESALMCSTCAAVWELYDSIFASRPDYRLWRTKIIPHFAPKYKQRFHVVPSRTSRKWGKWIKDAAAALNNNDPIVAWGAFRYLLP